MSKMLVLDGISSRYERIPMLMKVSLSVNKGEIACVLGANGAGKSTLLKVVLGIVKAENGRVMMAGEDITNLHTNIRVAKGIAVCSAASGTFAKMSVENNLKLGVGKIDGKELQTRLEEIYQCFPVLRERLRQKAGTLSGGERTMLALARALISQPQLLLLDEPSLGLAPIMVEEVYNTIARLKEQQNVTALIVEQNAQKALSVCDYGYILQKGQIVFAGTPEQLRGCDYIKSPVI